jgi:hypothetical protein
LEERAHRAVLQVDEARAVPADLADVDGQRLQARLDGRVAKVVEVSLVFRGFRIAGEVETAVRGELAPHLLPPRDQAFVDRVELVRSREDILHPVPLHDARLQEGRRRVGVVLQHLRIAASVPGEVEAPVERAFVGFPRLHDERVEILGNREAREVALLDHAGHGVDAALLQLVGGRFQLVHLGGGEAVARALVPVDAVHGVEMEAELLDLARPVEARDQLLSLQGLAARGVTGGAEAAREMLLEELPERDDESREELLVQLEPLELER